MTKNNKLKQCWGPVGAPALLSETLQAPWGQFPSLAQDLFAVRFVASKKAEATIEKARWYLSHLTPAIGPRPIDAIEPAELLVVLKKIEKAGKRETAV